MKVTVSALGRNRYRSRIEETQGSNFGAAHDFKLDVTKGENSLPSLEEFTRSISNGTVAGLGDVQEVGKFLFEKLFQGEVASKYAELKGRATPRKLRICLSLDASLINIPWEYLHDDSGFLIGHGYPIVRVLNELTGSKSSYAPIRDVLVAAANPKSEDYDQFDAAVHIAEIGALLKQVPGANVTVLDHASVNELLRQIRSNNYDALYFIGHGEAMKSTSRLICEGPGESPEALDGSRMAPALRQASRCRFVYLNSCSTAKTSVQNPFQGLAQRLMLDGEVAAVAAMQVDIRQNAGKEIAKAFFRELKNRSPEDAMFEARNEGGDSYSFGIPALYSFVNAPDAYEANRLKAFLSADESSSYSLLLASFYLGHPAEKGQPAIPKELDGGYPGETLAIEDTRSAVSIMGMLTAVTSPQRITICSSTDKPNPDTTHYFVFGSRSNPIMESIQKGYQDRFKQSLRFEYTDTGWYVHDNDYNHRYAVEPPPKSLTVHQYRMADDYGVIQKVVVSGQRIYFIVAGLGSRATEGCGWYLARHWQDHLAEKEFTIILKFPGGLDFSHARLIDRQTGQPKQ